MPYNGQPGMATMTLFLIITESKAEAGRILNLVFCHEIVFVIACAWGKLVMMARLSICESLALLHFTPPFPSRRIQ